MKPIALTVAAGIAAGTLLTGTAAVAAPGHPGADQHATTVQAGRSAPAAAASPKAAVPALAYNGACGAGYVQRDSMVLTGWGAVYLTYNSSNGYNCAVTVRSNPGGVQSMGVAVRISGNPSSVVVDSGEYTTYAGPVYLHAAGQCIDWWGWTEDVVQEMDHSHCG